MSPATRLVMTLLMMHAQEYDEADPVAWVDTGRLAQLACMHQMSVKRCLRQLRVHMYVGESVWRRNADTGWKQYGYRLGPACVDVTRLEDVIGSLV